MVGLTIEEAAAAGLDTNPRCGNGPPGLQAVLWKLSPTSDENLIDAAMPAESPEPGTGLILGTAFRRGAGGGQRRAWRRGGAIAQADAYFQSIGVTPSTKTRIPGNRRSSRVEKIRLLPSRHLARFIDGRVRPSEAQYPREDRG